MGLPISCRPHEFLDISFEISKCRPIFRTLFDAKTFEAIFVGYSNTSKAYRIFNKSTLTIEEFMHVKFEESNIFLRIL